MWKWWITNVHKTIVFPTHQPSPLMKSHLATHHDGCLPRRVASQFGSCGPLAKATCSARSLASADASVPSLPGAEWRPRKSVEWCAPSACHSGLCIGSWQRTARPFPWWRHEDDAPSRGDGNNTLGGETARLKKTDCYCRFSGGVTRARIVFVTVHYINTVTASRR